MMLEYNWKLFSVECFSLTLILKVLHMHFKKYKKNMLFVSQWNTNSVVQQMLLK